jgi:hypothetical protein
MEVYRDASDIRLISYEFIFRIEKSNESESLAGKLT